MMRRREVPVYIINGFLESGKTTFLQETMRDPQFLSAGNVLIIQCEEGEEELDEVALAKRKVSIISVEEEATLTEELLSGLEEFYRPNMVLVELNGMWKTEDFLEKSLPDNWVAAQIITLVDASTFSVYLANMRSIMLEQVKYSDLVIFNRCTDETDKGMLRRTVKAVNRKVQIIYEREDGIDTGEEEEELPFDITQPHLDICDEDFGIWYLDAMDYPEKYEGKTVSFLAMAYVSPKLPKGYFVPGRMAMTCCADDVAFIGFLCRPPIAMELSAVKNRQWYTVTAVMKKEYQKEYKGEGTVLYATSLTPTEAPADKLVYFN